MERLKHTCLKSDISVCDLVTVPDLRDRGQELYRKVRAKAGEPGTQVDIKLLTEK